ncbi:MAG TPA: 6-phosphofructokinase, partial [Bacilli bacterium]|nr:6-phosphofructokinase [Bacilli bacterium]
HTPSSAFGSVRYKLKDPNVDDTDYRRILEVFKKYNIRYFFYNGGNDSMDTCNKVSKFLQKAGYDCKIIGVPKTIDNDLYGTDHCPGFGSAARYVATTMMELYQDTHVYNTGLVTVVEIMGRNAGWLTAASALANLKGCGPDLIYLPEVPFDLDEFVEDVKRVASQKQGKVIVAISEGIKDKDGKYISEYATSLSRDSFGHAQLGGLAAFLANVINQKLNVKVRPIEFSLLQRCAAHIASKRDVEEAFMAGKMAVKYATSGYTDKMVCFVRDESSSDYKISYELLDLEKVANVEKKLPLEWIDIKNRNVTNEVIDYILPLIQGELDYPFEDGLPRFARLRKVLVQK